mgnify:CR=1 FL=1
MKKNIKMQTLLDNINDILGGKISEEKKKKLELLLINSPLDEKKKKEIIEFIRSII